MLDSGLMQKVDLETFSRELIRILDQTVESRRGGLKLQGPFPMS